MRRGLRAGMAAIAMGVAASLLLAGCGGKTAPTSAKHLPTVVIGYENNGADPEMAAMAEGFFQKYMKGAHVELRYFSSGPASLAALASGSLQFMTGLGNPPAAAAIGQGVPLKVIWAQERYTTDEGLVVRQGSGVRSLKDLEGKSIAMVVGSTSPFEVATAMAQGGIPSSAIKFANMSPPDMVSAWERGQIDAAYVWDPAFDTMLRHGGTALMYDQDVAQQAPIFNLAVVQTGWAKSHRQLVLGFIKAEQAGYAFYRSHPAQAVRDMAKEAGITVALAKTELKGYKLYSVQDQIGPEGLGKVGDVKSALVTVSLNAAAKYLYSIRQISTPPSDMSGSVDPSYAQAVAAGQ